MRIWHPHATLESLNREAHGTMIASLGIELTELGDDFLRGRMPVNERTVQPMRILHGGASVAFAETLGSSAAGAVLDPARATCVGQEINANHLRRAEEGSWVEGIARPFHIGARSQVWGIEITDAQQRRVCIARMTVAVIARER